MQHIIESLLEGLFETDTLYLGKLPIKIEVVSEIISKVLGILIIAILMGITIKVTNKIINKLVKRQIDSNSKFTMDEKKARTLGVVLKSMVRYAVYFVGVTAMLASIFGNISWAFASVGGVAVGLGAQSFVKDLINGVFILFEDQYAVGDFVTIDRFQGIVESIGLRTTELRDFNGDMHIIPNGIILSMTNHSKGNMRILVDVEVAYEEDIDNVINVINEVCDSYNNINENITKPTKVLGVMSLNASGVTIRVIGEAKPMTQWEAERELRKAIKEELDRQGIEIPYPKTHIVSKEAHVVSKV